MFVGAGVAQAAIRFRKRTPTVSKRQYRTHGNFVRMAACVGNVAPNIAFVRAFTELGDGVGVLVELDDGVGAWW